MHVKKSAVFVGISLLLGFALLLPGCGQETPAPNTGAQSPVELKMVGSFATSAPEWKITKDFVDQVNKELAGKVKITIAGGPELIPPTELANAVRTGAVDMSFSQASMYVSLVPEADAIKLATVSPADMRKNGAHDFLDKKFREKANGHFLGMTMFGQEWFHIFTNTKVEKADLSGHIFRSIPIYEPVLKALGAKVTTMDISEVVTAMDRKVITGFAYPVAGAAANFGTAAKYVLNPGFYAAEPIMVINQDKWNSLPEDVRNAVDKLAAKAEIDSVEWCKTWSEQSAKELKDKGVQFVDLPAGEKEKFEKVVFEAGWAKIKERSPDSYDQLKKLLTK
ncbi:MAG: TRAP transporter substrate-binding protein DctP [Peptococcaceae bacterium]|nr:TRAP transporter substrate-binding protein DctP [Peptococcaceae bacterium]